MITSRIVSYALLTMLAAASSNATSLTTGYAYTATGQACDPTKSATADRKALLPNDNSGVFTPANGCTDSPSMALDLHRTDSNGGTATASSSASFIPPGRTANGTYTVDSGQASATATLSSLHTDATQMFSGPSDANTLEGSESIAQFTNNYTFSSASMSGQPGLAEFDFHLSGESTRQSGDVSVSLYYRLAGSPDSVIYHSATAVISPASAYLADVGGSRYIADNGTSQDSRVTLGTAGTIGVNGDFAIQIQDTWDQSFDLEFSLVVVANSSTSLDSTAVDAGSYTFTLTGLRGLDTQGNTVSDARVIQESAATPEPATWMLGAALLPALIALKRHKK